MDETRWFGRYRLVELLGRGATGEVWRAFDPATRRMVALKVLRAGPALDREARLRFGRELGVVAALEEPHVARIHDFGEIEGRLFVTTALIDGRDLRDHLRDGALPPTRAVWIVEQAASALHAAHEAGVTHRDVKPSNILVAEDDLSLVIDFGVPTGNASWAYLAPERFQPGVPPTPVADVYSLACVLYESLTGERPYAGATPREVAEAHKFKPMPRASRIQPNLPAALDEVLSTGMAKNPRNRYPSARHLAKAARVALARSVLPPRLPPQAPPPPAPPRKAVPVSVRPTPRPAPRPVRPAVVVDAPTTRLRKPSTVPASPPPDPVEPEPAAPAPLSIPRWVSITFATVTSLVVGALVVGVFILGHGLFTEGNSEPPAATKKSTTSSSASGPAPVLVDEAALEQILLPADDIDTVVGTAGMKVVGDKDTLDDDAGIAPAACAAVGGTAQAAAYSGTGDTGVRDQKLQDGAEDYTHQVWQAVVRFPSAASADAFVNTSAQQWAACHEYTRSQNNSRWTREQLNNANGMLSAGTVRQNATAPGWACERALVAKNNVVVDVASCSPDPTGTGVAIARQVLAKVPGGR